ncbi:MAG: AraC family ligand binding domain-containing protein [Opitutales bacterium]
MSPESPLQQLRVGVTARERYPEGRYAWDNRDRTPHVIIQRTEVGRGWFEQNGRRAEIVAGQAFICEVPSATSYGAEPGAPYALEFLTIHGVLAMRLAGAFRSAFGPVVALSAMPESCSRFRELVRLWSERRLRDPFDEAIRLFELFASLHREASRAAHPADPVAAVHERIGERFREPLTI